MPLHIAFTLDLGKSFDHLITDFVRYKGTRRVQHMKEVFSEAVKSS